MWMSGGKYSGQKQQAVQRSCSRNVSDVFEKCQGDSGGH